MSESIHFKGVFPIGDSDPQALPVKDIGPAIGYYTQVLGFTVISRDEVGAVLTRDDVTVGLQKNDADPEQISCYFSVSGVEKLREEYEAKGIAPSALRVDEHNGNRYKVFFAKEPYGVCFCFGQEIDA